MLLKSKHGVGNERKAQREGTYVYLWLIHAGVWQKPTQYCNCPSVKNKLIKRKKKERDRDHLLLQNSIQDLVSLFWPFPTFYHVVVNLWMSEFEVLVNTARAGPWVNIYPNLLPCLEHNKWVFFWADRNQENYNLEQRSKNKDHFHLVIFGMATTSLTLEHRIFRCCPLIENWG